MLDHPSSVCLIRQPDPKVNLGQYYQFHFGMIHNYNRSMTQNDSFEEDISTKLTEREQFFRAEGLTRGKRHTRAKVVVIVQLELVLELRFGMQVS